jgi:amidase
MTLVDHSATDLAARLRSGELSAVDVMNAHYDRIEKVNPRLNAIVNLLPRERAVALAEQADRLPAEQRGVLHGLPMACKDAVEVAGFPTTWGFVPFADHVASADDAMASRLRAAGALFIGKTNMPEFGLGSNTFNRVFGPTLNPFDATKSAGGSSGGAAVGLATRMFPLADGSDMGGSLRNPASFCNVVGLRTTPGRLPSVRSFGWFARLSVSGPMARTVEDAALLLSVQAGPCDADPLTLPESGEVFRAPLDAPMAGRRIAFSPNLGGLPIARSTAAVIATAPAVFEGLGCKVEQTEPDLSGAMDVFQVQRAAALAALGQGLEKSVPDWRKHTKDTAIWNIEKGFALTGDEIIQSELRRTEIYRSAVEFLERFDALILPAAQVPPFDIKTEWVDSIEGHKMDSYIDWMTVCCAITVTGLPAISVPAGFTEDGLPVGLQIVGRPRGEWALLQIAHAFESATQHHRQAPPLD